MRGFTASVFYPGFTLLFCYFLFFFFIVIRLYYLLFCSNSLFLLLIYCFLLKFYFNFVFNYRFICLDNEQKIYSIPSYAFVRFGRVVEE